MYISLLAALYFLLYCNAVAPPGPWDAFNFAPSSRTVRPKSIFSTSGQVTGSQQLISNFTGVATISGRGSFVVIDFGQEVGGTLSLTIVRATAASGLSLAFTESSEFVDPLKSDDSCHSVATGDGDGVQNLPSPLRIGAFTQTIGEQRGGFRYLTVATTGDAPVSISSISLHTTWMPHWNGLRAYTGYFFARDNVFRDPEFLNKLWYAGAYTVQTNTIDSHQARQQPCPRPQGWANNATGGPVEGPILVDGAKRDRTIWPGDIGISSHTAFVSLNDLLPSKNALTVMFSTQDPVTGALQYSGPPINARGSDTYICWSIIGTHNYWLYTGDLDFVRTVWGNYTKALAFLQSQVDSSGLMNVPTFFANDWGRDNGQGHNSAANAVLYRSLVTASELADQLDDAELSAAYSVNATALKKAYNNILWDSSVGMFRDSDTSTLIPQDGNALAVLFNVTNTKAQNEAISEGLTKFWTDIGPLSPELNDTIIPFVGGFEVQAHFIAGQGERALDLIRKGLLAHHTFSWGYMLYTNLSVQSTLLEGFTANGSLGYRAAAGYDFDHSYTSHAHGWATGPTPALTFFVLGLTVTSPQGATWSIAPVTSGLDSAEGGFETGLGWFGVKWSIKNGTFMLSIEVPRNTRGTVAVPGTGRLQVDGKDFVLAEDSLLRMAGGSHTIIRVL